MKHLFFLVICLLLAGSVSAQTYYYGPRRLHRRPAQQRQDEFYRPQVGLTGGLNVANTIDSYDGNYSTDNILGFHAGITATIPLIYPLSFQPEVLFSQQGYKAYTADGDFTQRNNYIDIPLLANFRLVRGLNFVIGPQLNFPISSTNTYYNGFTVDRETYYNDNTNKSSLAGVVGLSIGLGPNVDLRARYVLDLTSNTQDANSPIPDYRNQVWQFGLAFKFQ